MTSALVDVVIVGDGPAGSALAQGCTRRGLSTCLVGPDADWEATYGCWIDDLAAPGNGVLDRSDTSAWFVRVLDSIRVVGDSTPRSRSAVRGDRQSVDALRPAPRSRSSDGSCRTRRGRGRPPPGGARPWPGTRGPPRDRRRRMAVAVRPRLGAVVERVAARVADRLGGGARRPARRRPRHTDADGSAPGRRRRLGRSSVDDRAERGRFLRRTRCR